MILPASAGKSFSGALNARLRRALQDPAAPFRPEIRNIEESE